MSRVPYSWKKQLAAFKHFQIPTPLVAFSAISISRSRVFFPEYSCLLAIVSGV